MGRRPKYPPGHPKFRLNMTAFPRGFSVLIARASRVLGIPARTYCYAVLAREAIQTLISAQNRPLRIVPGTRIWTLGGDMMWRVEWVADGTETCFIQDQVHGLPQMLAGDGTGVSVFVVGKGPGFVVRYCDLCWDGKAPSGVTVTQFFRNLFTPGGDVRDEKLVGLLSPDDPLPGRMCEGPGRPLPSRDASLDGRERGGPPAADPGTHRAEVGPDPEPRLCLDERLGDL